MTVIRAFRIPSGQIPRCWEIIKLAAVKADGVSKFDEAPYLNKLLNNLLSGKSQCFIKMSDDVEMKALAVAITSILFDELTDERVLYIKCFYSFQKDIDQGWIESFNILKEFAVKQKCKKIITRSVSETVFELIKKLGFKERYRSFVMDLDTEV